MNASENVNGKAVSDVGCGDAGGLDHGSRNPKHAAFVLS
jgi:hypothetical protein